MTFDWIFFDCFNTLIDDFDPNGEPSGLGGLRHIPVQAGLYPSAAAFAENYLQWRSQQWQDQWQEIHLADRLRAVLQQRSPHMPTHELDELVAAMVATFTREYAQVLRLPTGVIEMLDHWQPRVKMGVISNFHLPHWPANCLDLFGIKDCFEFVLDSAACGYRKPGPEVYSLACNLAGIAPEERHRVLFIGDHLQNDVLKPRQLGMQSLYFDRSLQRPSSSPVPTDIPFIQSWQDFRATTLSGHLLPC